MFLLQDCGTCLLTCLSVLECQEIDYIRTPKETLKLQYANMQLLGITLAVAWVSKSVLSGLAHPLPACFGAYFYTLQTAAFSSLYKKYSKGTL